MKRTTFLFLILGLSAWGQKVDYLTQVQNRPGYDFPVTTVVSASTIAAPTGPSFIVTGTTTITKITGGWVGRTISLIFTDASPGGVATGGSGAGRIGKTQAVSQNQVLTLIFDGTYWYPEGGEGGIGELNITLDSATVGTENTLNFVTGNGILLTGSNPTDKVNMQVEIDTAVVLQKTAVFTKSISLFDPVAGDSGRIQFAFGSAATITRVYCSTKTATSTVTMNLDERAEATPDTSGTNVLSADLVCDTGTRTSCASGCDVNTITNGSIAANAPVALTIASVANAPTDVRVHVDYTIQ